MRRDGHYCITSTSMARCVQVCTGVYRCVDAKAEWESRACQVRPSRSKFMAKREHNIVDKTARKHGQARQSRQGPFRSWKAVK